MTVSNVLRNRAGRMSEETRQRVLCAIQELNYIPIPRPAMQNRHVETRAIGVAFLDDMRFMEVGDMQERLCLFTFAGIRDRAHQHRYDLLLLCRTCPDWMGPGAEAQFLDRRCDGIIFVGNCPRKLTESLARHRLPAVVCYSADTPPGVAHVLADGATAMRLAVDHLWDLGHRRIGHFGGPAWSYEANERRTNFQEALRRRGGQTRAGWVTENETWGGDAQTGPAAEALLAQDVTAVVCANDLLALDLWRAAEARGLGVPGDLALTGMDDTEEGRRRGLTSIVNPFHRIGAEAVEALLSLICGDEDACTGKRLPVEMIVRDSTGPATPAARDVRAAAPPHLRGAGSYL